MEIPLYLLSPNLSWGMFDGYDFVFRCQGFFCGPQVFEGIVKASYVQLTIGNQADEKKIYQLVVGDKDRQKNFPWNVQTVESGYFFVELPQGQYRIMMISVPAGTTMASEFMDIVFDIRPEKALYLGTLKVVGTKEKVKLGGVPVIQPGFEYTVEILNEQADALREFRQHFPGSSKPVEINLMRVNVADNKSSETNTAVQK
jgi:hypothetical protein